MQFKGKIIEALPVVTGQGARGQWVKQGFVLEYESGQYPKSIAFDVFGDERLQKFRISVGDELICDIDFKALKGRNGNTFNSVDCWNVTRVAQEQAQTHAQMQPQYPTQPQYPQQTQYPQPQYPPQQQYPQQQYPHQQQMMQQPPQQPIANAQGAEKDNTLPF